MFPLYSSLSIYAYVVKYVSFNNKLLSYQKRHTHSQIKQATNKSGMSSFVGQWIMFKVQVLPLAM